MEVVYYQIAIIITIIVTRVFKNEWLVAVCILWTLETILLLGYLPLVIIQLSVVWGAYLLIYKYDKKNSEIRELRGMLENAVRDKERDIKQAARSVSSNDIGLLQNEEHIRYLRKSIRKANHHIIIFSGWITNYVVNTEFVRLLEQAAERGVNIYVGYGYENAAGAHTPIGGGGVAIHMLEQLHENHQNRFFMGRFATHEKILVVDYKVVVYGSFNWLANSRAANAERSVVLQDRRLAELESVRSINIVESNLG